MELVTNTQGITREAVIVLPSHRHIRRPLNLLIPLDLEITQSQDKNNQQSESNYELPPPHSEHEPNEPSNDHPTVQPTTSPDTSLQKSKYNLRPRRQINYGDLINFSQIIHISMILSILSLLLSTVHYTEASASIRQLECINGGVKITSPDQTPYELCTEEYCKIYDTPHNEEIVHLPPQIVLHDYKV
ncbi:hypothetical protein KIN20_000967 [Parelaphostrongylus tenuis]|uniref:Uncharacterized protein n=1 Tax=Parelaphostrongylus tenuis TaxID=148309 RepID=A0AAD5LVG5_PARTN|nr:hypothetical protein KIN20_000967 [Parelaphostrongylus tenuis]